MPSSPASEGPQQVDELAEIEERLAQVEDRYKRALADLDNYRKRSSRLIEERVAEEREAMLRDWLTVLDSVERSLRMDASDTSGMQAVLEQIDALLQRQGVARVGAVGEPFDPTRHEAIGVQDDADTPDGTIAELARSGFALGDRILRPAQVVVARHTEPTS
jgi:molecular chaperone GrpE